MARTSALIHVRHILDPSQPGLLCHSLDTAALECSHPCTSTLLRQWRHQVSLNTLLVCQWSRNAKSHIASVGPCICKHHHSTETITVHPTVCNLWHRIQATGPLQLPTATSVMLCLLPGPAELWLDMAMAHAPNHVACPAQSNQIQRTSNAHHEIHGCCWLGGLDCPHDIAIRDEPDACTLGHQLVMPRAVENQHCAIPSHMWTVTRFPYAVISSKACLTGVHVRFHGQVSICSLSAAECLLYGM